MRNQPLHYADSNEKNGAPVILFDLTIFFTKILHLTSSFLLCFLLLCLKFLQWQNFNIKRDIQADSSQTKYINNASHQLNNKK